jgi:hypothetical protein
LLALLVFQLFGVKAEAQFQVDLKFKRLQYIAYEPGRGDPKHHQSGRDATSTFTMPTGNHGLGLR